MKTMIFGNRVYILTYKQHIQGKPSYKRSYRCKDEEDYLRMYELHHAGKLTITAINGTRIARI